MELEQLRQLNVIAQCGTLQKAAQELHLSQSALSRSLKRLEGGLGQELFDRTHNSLKINDVGQMVLEHAQAILAEERRLYDDLDALAKRARTLRVASVAPAPTWRLSSLILEQSPTAILEPDISSQSSVESKLINGSCDFALTTQPTRLPSLESFVFMGEDLYANIPVTNPLHTRDELSFAELDGSTFLVYEQIGFWLDVHRRNMPHASFVTQPDRTIFLQQVRTSDLLTFTTNAPENTSSHVSRVAVPLTDADAHATYHLCMRCDAPEHVRTIYEALRTACVGEC